MNLEELIRVIENQIQQDKEKAKDYIYRGEPFSFKAREMKIKICYMRNFIEFLKKEKYNNIEESISKYHEQYLENEKKEIENEFDETKIKEKIKDLEHKLILPNFANEFNNLQKILIAIQEKDEKVIEKEKNIKFNRAEQKAKKLNKELLETLLLGEDYKEKERRKLLQEKEYNEIENEDLRKVTDLILNCIKESKEEILQEIKKLIKD